MNRWKTILLVAALWLLPATAFAAPMIDGRFTDWVGQAHVTAPAQNGATRHDIAALYWASDKDLMETYWMVERRTTNRAPFNTFNGQRDPVTYYLFLDLNDNGRYTDAVDKVARISYQPLSGSSDVTVELFDQDGTLLYEASGDWGEPIESGGQRVEWSLSLADLDLAPDQRFRVYVIAAPLLAITSPNMISSGENGYLSWGEYRSSSQIDFGDGATVEGIVESPSQITFGENATINGTVRSRSAITFRDGTTGTVVADSHAQIFVGDDANLTARLFSQSHIHVGKNARIYHPGTRIMRSPAQIKLGNGATVTCDAAPCMEENTTYQPGELQVPTGPVMPSINWNTLRARATERHTGHQTFTDFSEGGDRIILVENGHVELSGPVSGRVVLVATNGHITVTGPVAVDDPLRSSLTLVVNGKVTVEQGHAVHLNVISVNKTTLEDHVWFYGFIFATDKVELGNGVHFYPNQYAALTTHQILVPMVSGGRVPSAGEIQLSEVPALGWTGLGVTLVIGAGLATLAVKRRGQGRAPA